MIGIVLLTTIFSLIIALIFYGIGYYGGSKVLKKCNIDSKKSGYYIKGQFFNTRNIYSLLIVRLLPFSRTYVSILSGVYKQNFYKYLLVSSVSILVWNSIFVTLGFGFLINLEYIYYLYKSPKTLILILLGVSIILILVLKLKYKKRWLK